MSMVSDAIASEYRDYIRKEIGKAFKSKDEAIEKNDLFSKRYYEGMIDGLVLTASSVAHQ